MSARKLFRFPLAALLAAALLAPVATPASANDSRETTLDLLFDRLAVAGDRDWEKIQNEILNIWYESGSDTHDLLLARAQKAMEMEDYETAIVHLNDLVRLAPDFPEGWNLRATARFQQGEYGYALYDIGRTLALEPRHFGALSGLGIILDRMGDKEGALRAFERAIELHPNLPGADEGARALRPVVDGMRL